MSVTNNFKFINFKIVKLNYVNGIVESQHVTLDFPPLSQLLNTVLTKILAFIPSIRK